MLAELDYWCHTRLTCAAWIVFLDDVLEGVYRPDSPTILDLERCKSLQEHYADLTLGVVDASGVALTERLHEPKVASLDHRHFATVRPTHVNALTLLP